MTVVAALRADETIVTDTKRARGLLKHEDPYVGPDEGGDGVRIEELNALDAGEAHRVLAPAARVERWLQALVAGRPYDGLPALLERARSEAAGWTRADVDAALADHPRIGERPTGTGAEAELSRREQAAIVRSDDTGDDGAALERAIADGNRAYEERFGRVFLIRAAGRSRTEIRDELHRRLANAPDEEDREVADQLLQIALLRLEGMFA